MTTFQHGPVDLHLIEFDGERPSEGVLNEIRKLLDSGIVRLLDFAFISRAADGSVTVLELDQVANEFGLTGVVLDEQGLAAVDDIDEFAEDIEPGRSAALIAVELVWAKGFAAALHQAGGEVIHSETIPAAVVNEVLAASSEEPGA
jgi:uncharacterized membrane protein